MPWQRPNIGSRVTREGHARFSAGTCCGRRRSGPRCSPARRGLTCSVQAAARAGQSTFERSTAIPSLLLPRWCWGCAARGARNQRRCRGSSACTRYRPRRRPRRRICDREAGLLSVHTRRRGGDREIRGFSTPALPSGRNLSAPNLLGMVNEIRGVRCSVARMCLWRS
jgi:hypothetical protein